VRSGPWLLVHAQGSAPLATVEQVRRQCDDAGITTDSMPIDACGPDDTHIYTCLVVVLPTILDQSWPIFAARLDELLRRYRTVRRAGLKALLDRQIPWHRAGVVQLIGPRAIISHPMLSETQQRVCVRHYLSPAPLDVLLPYNPSAPPPSRQPIIIDPTLDGDARCLPSWRYLQTWGVTSIRSIPTLRLHVEACREHFEDQRYPALYRPVPGLDANRLSMILDNHTYHPTARERKTYLENGARVWRYVLRELRKVEPTFARPNERTNTRDAQKDLRLFYAALCPLDEYLKLIPDNEWDVRFKDD
jgi:hypothetical protein